MLLEIPTFLRKVFDPGPRFCRGSFFVDMSEAQYEDIKLGPRQLKYFLFSPRTLGPWAYFSNGLVQPPTSKGCKYLTMHIFLTQKLGEVLRTKRLETCTIPKFCPKKSSYLLKNGDSQVLVESCGSLGHLIGENGEVTFLLLQVLTCWIHRKTPRGNFCSQQIHLDVPGS